MIRRAATQRGPQALHIEVTAKLDGALERVSARIAQGQLFVGDVLGGTLGVLEHPEVDDAGEGRRAQHQERLLHSRAGGLQDGCGGDSACVHLDVEFLRAL